MVDQLFFQITKWRPFHACTYVSIIGFWTIRFTTRLFIAGFYETVANHVVTLCIIQLFH